jgi:2,3-bisphosphoglycerate-independent phosphoglycerate mutase
LRAGAALEDVAPTILGLLGLEQPAEMTGRDLREL